MGGLRRQSRRAPLRLRRGAADLGRHDGRARARAADAGEARAHRACLDRSAERAARALLSRRAGTAVRAGLGAARHGAVRKLGRRRGRGGRSGRRRDRREGEELARPALRSMKRLFLLAALLAGCAAPQPDQPQPTPEPEPPPPVVTPAPPVVTPAPTPPRSENVAVAGLMETARSESAAGRLSTAAAA